MLNRSYILAAATAATIGIAATLVGPGNAPTAATTTTPVRDANVPAPQIALPFSPYCTVQPFDTGQFQSLAPPTGSAPYLADARAHVLSICDAGTITIFPLGTP